ncbi:MAG: phasin family protein [Candidatus Wallbacteria bacterium]|nr:phasin family protein [Candidatus Wallbacteria bacterium]
MRIIKRYANRKLYDTSVRRYINLVEIAELVQKGSEVKVVDSKTGEDITKVTLSQILLEKEKRKQGFVPKTLFANLIRKGGTSIVDYVKRSAKGGLGFIHWAEDEIDKGVKKLVHARQITESEAKRLREDIVHRLLRTKEDWEKAIDDRIQSMLHRLNIPAQRDIVRLTEKLSVLARKVESLNGKAKKSPSAAKPAVAVKGVVRRKVATKKAGRARVEAIGVTGGSHGTVEKADEKAS